MVIGLKIVVLSIEYSTSLTDETKTSRRNRDYYGRLFMLHAGGSARVMVHVLYNLISGKCVD